MMVKLTIGLLLLAAVLCTLQRCDASSSSRTRRGSVSSSSGSSSGNSSGGEVDWPEDPFASDPFAGQQSRTNGLYTPPVKKVRPNRKKVLSGFVNVFVDGSAGAHGESTLFGNLAAGGATENSLFISRYPVKKVGRFAKIDSKDPWAEMKDVLMVKPVTVTVGATQMRLKLDLPRTRVLNVFLFTDGARPIEANPKLTSVTTEVKQALSGSQLAVGHTALGDTMYNPSTHNVKIDNLLKAIAKPMQQTNTKVFFYLFACYGASVVNKQLPLIYTKSYGKATGLLKDERKALKVGNTALNTQGLALITISDDIRALQTGAITTFLANFPTMQTSKKRDGRTFGQIVEELVKSVGADEKDLKNRKVGHDQPTDHEKPVVNVYGDQRLLAEKMYEKKTTTTKTKKTTTKK